MIKIRLGLACFVVVASLSFSTALQADIVTYDFTNPLGTNGSQIDLPAVFAASTVDAGATAGSFTFGAGLNSLTGVGTVADDYFQIAEGNGVANGINDDIADAIANNEYVSFSVTASGTNTLDLDNLQFDVFRAANGTNDYAVRSSVDAFATDIVFANQAITTTRTGQVVDLTDPSFDGLSTVEFRIYVDDRQNNSNGNSATIFDAVVLNGTVVAAVPEPSSAALLALGGLGMLTRRRK